MTRTFVARGVGRRVALAAAAALMVPLYACPREGGPARPSDSPSAAVTPSSSPSAKTIEGFRFAVIGDFGSTAPAQQRVADAMCARHGIRPFGDVISVGDNVYPDGRPSRFDAVFAVYACLAGRGVRFHSALGNHDVLTDGGRPEIEDARFGMPAANFVYREGGVRFVVADSNELDRPWLDAALVPEPGDRWTIAVFHHPVYSPGTEHGSTPGFEDLPALFARHRVDLVLNGHDHIYAVTPSLDGIRYVVTGGGGSALYGCVPRPFAETCVARHHFLDVTVGRDRIEVLAVDSTGTEFDRFSTPGLP